MSSYHSEVAAAWERSISARGSSPARRPPRVWDKSTDGGHCEQWIKAVFDDGESSPAKRFDFCEKDLVLAFS